MRIVTSAVVAAAVGLAALSAPAVVGALKKGDSAKAVSLQRPSFTLGDFSGQVTLVNFNGWT